LITHPGHINSRVGCDSGGFDRVRVDFAICRFVAFIFHPFQICHYPDYLEGASHTHSIYPKRGRAWQFHAYEMRCLIESFDIRHEKGNAEIKLQYRLRSRDSSTSKTSVISSTVARSVFLPRDTLTFTVTVHPSALIL
jgi:hypothetical protein